MEEKQRMSSGRWLGAFAATIALLAALVAGFNFVTDPFGAFGTGSSSGGATTPP